MRLTNLEFFVTAIVAPIILTLTHEDKYIFGVIDATIISKKNGTYDDSWYVKHGMGMFVQMFVYFLVLNIVFTYLLKVFPYWIL